MKSVTPNDFKTSSKMNKHWTKLDYEISNNWAYVEYPETVVERGFYAEWCKEQESNGRYMLQPKGIFFEDPKMATYFKLAFKNK